MRVAERGAPGAIRRQRHPVHQPLVLERGHHGEHGRLRQPGDAHQVVAADRPLLADGPEDTFDVGTANHLVTVERLDGTAHSFTAPELRPVTNRRWMSAVNKAMGTMASELAAAIGPQSSVRAETKPEM